MLKAEPGISVQPIFPLSPRDKLGPQGARQDKEAALTFARLDDYILKFP